MYQFVDSNNDLYQFIFRQSEIFGLILSINKTCKRPSIPICTTTFDKALNPCKGIIHWVEGDIPYWISEEARQYIDRLYKNRAFL